MRLAIIGGVLLTTAMMTFTRASVAEPSEIGYERWTPTGNVSGIIVNRPPEWYYGTYTNKLAIGLPMSQPPSPYRLIDIELTGSEKEGYLMDGVWVQNLGDFETSSWMVHGLKAYDVLSIAALDDLVILDIEGYESAWGKVQTYAIIVKKNPKNFDYEVLLEVTEDFLLSKLASGQWRAIDIDVLHNDWPGPMDHQAWKNVRYNGIFVENTAGNFKNTRLRQSQSAEDVVDAALDGMQLIDMEPTLACVVVQENSCPEWIIDPCEQPACETTPQYLSLYVDNGLPYVFKPELPLSNVTVEALNIGRGVDAEQNLPVNNIPAGSISVVLVP